MTVKFSSVHIKWKSLLTFPQTEQARESRRRAGEQKCAKGEFRCRTSASERMRATDGAQVRGSLSQNLKTSREATWTQLTLAARESCLIAPKRAREREQRRRFKSPPGPTAICVSGGHVLRLTAESQPQDLNPASSFWLILCSWMAHTCSFTQRCCC